MLRSEFAVKLKTLIGYLIICGITFICLLASMYILTVAALPFNTRIPQSKSGIKRTTQHNSWPQVSVEIEVVPVYLNEIGML